MAQTFARIAAGIVAEIITIEPGEPSLSERFHPQLVQACVQVSTGISVKPGWCYDGLDFSEPLPPVPPAVTIPTVISRTQGLLALLLGPGITEQSIRTRVALIASETEREVTRLRFEAASWRRDSEFIAWGAEQFDLTERQVDDLFIAASGL